MIANNLISSAYAAASPVASERAKSWKGELPQFSNWGKELQFKWKWEHYNNDPFIHYDIDGLFRERARGILGYLSIHKRCLMEFLASTQQQHTPQLHIVSFASGPGTDAVAIVAFINWPTKTPSFIQWPSRSPFDPVKRWRHTAKAAVQAVLGPSDSVEFIEGCWETPKAITAALRNMGRARWGGGQCMPCTTVVPYYSVVQLGEVPRQPARSR
jgi:hypothetical protein